MRIKHLKLQNFRNHRSLELDFAEKDNVMVFKGSNGSGKTSILEAFYYSSFIKSFRCRNLQEILAWDEEHFRVELHLDDDDLHKVELFHAHRPAEKRVFKMNGVVKDGAELMGQIKAVIFVPRDLLMLTDEPILRRSYLNRLLIQSEKSFVPTLMAYQKALKQRNTLLKRSVINEQELVIWDEQLAKYGHKIVQLRAEGIETLKAPIGEHYSQISGQECTIDLKYSSNAPADEQEYLRVITMAHNKDKFDRVTSVGPHRDDFQFFINGRNVKYCASQGELRSLVLSLKLAEAAFIRQKTGTAPILLFDDVFSELDPSRQRHLLKHLEGHQVFISTAEEHCLIDDFKGVKVVGL